MITSHTEVPGGAILKVKEVRLGSARWEVLQDLLRELRDEGFTDIWTNTGTVAYGVHATAPDGSTHRWYIELRQPWVPYVLSFLQSIYGPHRLYP